MAPANEKLSAASGAAPQLLALCFLLFLHVLWQFQPSAHPGLETRPEVSFPTDQVTEHILWLHLGGHQRLEQKQPAWG